MRNKEQYETVRRLREAEGGAAYHLDVFGDTLAQREGYKSVDGLEAVQLYLIHKHHWLPRDVRSMSAEDLRFSLSEEMHNWTVPAAALPPKG